MRTIQHDKVLFIFEFPTFYSLVQKLRRNFVHFLKTRKKIFRGFRYSEKSEVMDLQIDSSMMTLVSACSSDKKCALNFDLFSNCTVVLYFREHLVQIQAILLTWFSISLGQIVQVNLCQKLLFSYQLTHNITTDCPLNYKFNI